MPTSISLSKKLDQLDIPAEEKELIVENGVRYRILELETQLKKIRDQVESMEGSFGQSLESLEKKGLPDEADFEVHDRFMDLKALRIDENELKEKLNVLKKILAFDETAT